MTKADLPALLERIKAAMGPSRELDAEAWNALPDPDYPSRAYNEANCAILRTLGREPRYHDGWLIQRRADDAYPDDLPCLSASLDATLALCARVKPGWDVRLSIYRPADGDDGFVNCKIEPNCESDDAGDGAGANAPTPALALLAALVAAEMESGKEGLTDE